MQSYPQDKIEIIVVDDDSTDDTLKIAMEFGCITLRNGEHNIERGKSIGVEASNGEYILLIDDDNRIPNNTWLIDLLKSVIKENCIGGQASKFYYDRNDTLINRYASLFGLGDPTVFYLNKKDKLMFIEKTWNLPGKVIKETDRYYVVQFDKSNLLTIGSQGFLIKKEFLIKTTHKPYLYHMDLNMELVSEGLNTYVMLKDTIIHKYSDTISQFYKKLKRNISLFYSEKQYRKYTYRLKKSTMLRLGLTMCTFIIPLFDSIKGYIKLHDSAWFIHPFICFRVGLIYSIFTIKQSLFNKYTNEKK